MVGCDCTALVNHNGNKNGGASSLHKAGFWTWNNSIGDSMVELLRKNERGTHPHPHHESDIKG